MNISVTVMTPKQFVEGFNGSIAGCAWRGRPLDCAFTPYSNDTAGHAAYRAAGTAPPSALCSPSLTRCGAESPAPPAFQAGVPSSCQSVAGAACSIQRCSSTPRGGCCPPW